MTRDPHPNSEWWDFDPSEEPVPLTNPAGQGTFAIADEAESIVRSARDDLARENTDPTGWATEWPARSRSNRRRRGAEGSMPRLSLAALLIVGCVGMFSDGWAQGSAARDLPRPSVQRGGGDEDATDVKNATQRVSSQRSTGEKRLIPEKSTAKEVQK